MAVVTISRQYGSGGESIARRVCELTGYRSFDKDLMAEVALEVGLAQSEVVDLSDDEMRGFWNRLFGGTVAQARVWQEGPTGVRTPKELGLSETRAFSLTQGTILAAYRHGNIVIVGRGGQALLADRPDVLHVRVVAPLEDRVARVQADEQVSPGTARDLVARHDRASASYLKRHYGVDGTDALYYHLVINSSRCGLDPAAQTIAGAVGQLPAARA